MESFSVEAILSAVDKNFSATMKSAEGSMGGLDDKAQKAGTSVMDIAKGAGVFKLVDAGIGMVKDSLGGAIKRFDTLNNSTRSFENMGFSAKEVDTTMTALKASIQGLPTPLDAAISGVQLLASSTEDIGKSQEIFAALNNGILGFGGTTAQVDNAVTQLSQSFSNGKVDAQTWNSMINSGLGPSLSALAKTMNKTTGELKEGLSSGSISVSEFQNALIDLNKNGGGGLKSLEQIAKDATGGIDTGIANMKTAITRGVANIITSVNESLKGADLGSIGEFIGGIGSKAEAALTKIAELVPPAIKFIGDLYEKIEPFLPLILGVVTFIGTYQAVMGTATKAVKVYTTAQEIMNAVLSANPIGILITSIAILVGTIIYLWNTNEDFRAAVIGIWEGIKETFSNAIEGIKNAWSGTKEFFSGLWDGIKDSSEKAANGMGSAWKSTTSWFSETWQSIKDGFIKTWSSITGWFEAKIELIKSIFKAGLDFILSYIGPYINGFKNAFMHISYAVEAIFKGVVEIGKNYFEILKNVVMAPILFITSFITGGWEEAKNNMIAVWNNIKEAGVNIWNTIKETFESVHLNIKMAILNVWIGIKMTVSNIWTSISETATEVWTGIKNFFSQTWQSIKDGTVVMWEGLKTWLSDTWEALKTGAVNTWEGIKTSVSDAWTATKELVVNIGHAIVDGVKTAWEDFKTGVLETVETVKSLFNRLREIDLFEIGKNVVQGLIDGIGNMISAVGSKIKEVASSVTDGLKKALGIHSPSRVVRDQVGKQIPAGMAVGINQNTKAAVQAAKLASKKVSDSISITSNQYSTGRISGTQFEANLKAIRDNNKLTVAQQNSINTKLFNLRRSGQVATAKQNNDAIKLNNNVIKANNNFFKKAQDINKNLIKDIKATKDAYKAQVAQMKDSIYNQTGLFDNASSKFATKQGLTGNLKGQLDQFKEWRKNINAISKKIPKDMANELRGMGTGSAGEIKALTTMSGAELNAYVKMWKEKNSLASQEATFQSKDALKQSQAEIRALTSAAGKELTGAKNEWAKSLNAFKADAQQVASFKGNGNAIGQNVGQGLVNGLKGMSGPIRTASSNLANSVVSTMRKSLGIHSPARVIRDQVGRFIPAGLAVGIDKYKGLVDQSLENLVDTGIAMTSLDNIDKMMSRSNNQTINAESELLINDGNKSLSLQINLGKQKFKAFVEDISEAIGGEADLIVDL